MRIKPILFNSEMVRAILDGRKTVTRRMVRGAWPEWSYLGLTDDAAVTAVDRYGEEYPKPVDGLWAEFEDADGPVEFPMVKTPYHPGDVLWVRETWAYGCTFATERKLFYRADGDSDDVYRWRPSIHMPREAARIFLRVTNVRVERLNDIDEAGAIAEGLYEGYRYHGVGSCALSARQAFSWFWQFITLDAPAWQHWALSPWVWVIEFERCEKPEEE